MCFRRILRVALSPEMSEPHGGVVSKWVRYKKNSSITYIN